MKFKECPQCGQDISHTYEPIDEDVGIMSDNWYCEQCDLVVNNDGKTKAMDDQ